MNILIIEDESQTSALLKEMIEQDTSRLVLATLDSIEEAVLFLKKKQAHLDLLFLDIHLADGSGFEIFEQIKVEIPVVFCTAYDEYALKAFQSNGIAYILKPFKEEDIEEVFAKLDQLRAKWGQNSDLQGVIHGLQTGQKTQSSFLVKLKDKMYPIAVSDIALIMLENEVVYLYNFQGHKYPIFKTMDQIEEALDAQSFFRINRQVLMNRSAIQEIEPYFNRKVIVKLKNDVVEPVVVSRLKVSPFLTWIERPS